MRTLPALLLVALAPALALGSSTVPAAGDVPAPLPVVQARSAAGVVDGFGVGVHLAYGDTPYADAGAVTRALTTLGVRHVRDDLFPGNTTQYAAIRQVAAQGIGFDLIMGNPRSPRPAADYVAAVAQHLPGAVESLEGPNEWDHFSGGAAGWPAQVRARQAALYAAADAEPRTAALPVLAPSLAFAKNYPLVGDLSSMSDVANGHLYPGGRPPSADVAGLYGKLRAVTGAAKPVVVTEAGYHNAIRTTDGHHPVPESVHATYLPRMLMEHLRAGGSRVYSYELIDEFADPGKVDPEANFGLLRRDLTPKPAYTAMQRFLGIFRSSAATHVPQRLAYQVVGGGSDLRQQLVQQSNGEFDLVLWRDVSVWDPIARRSLSPAPYRVQVRLEQARAGSVVTPASGASTSFGPLATVPVDLGADLTVVRLPAPVATPAPTTAPAPTATPTPTPVAKPVTAPATVPVAAPAVAVPGRSTAVRARPGRASVRVGWGAPRSAGAPVREYRLRVGPRSVVVPATARSAVLTGLPRRAAVRVAVQARNDGGWGAVAWSTRVRTR